MLLRKKRFFSYIPSISGGVVVGTVVGIIGNVGTGGVGGGSFNIVQIQLAKGFTRVNRPSDVHILRKFAIPTNSYC
jgi:hypothetical protein